MLELAGVSRSFSGLRALAGVSFGVAPGEIKAVIGPNGAGKTTLFNIVTGVYPPDSGSIRFRGKPIVGLAAYRVAQLGLARTFQQPQVFRTLTVIENVMLGRNLHGRAGVFGCGLRLARAVREDRAARDYAMSCIKRVGMEAGPDRIASELPLGQQRYLEIARALALEPSLLLLDEPAAGLNDSETAALGDLLLRLRSEGLTILVIEHHMKFVMQISDTIAVLDFGEKIADAAPAVIRASPAVIRAYLGDDSDD